jgi:hypothetical protein
MDYWRSPDGNLRRLLGLVHDEDGSFVLSFFIFMETLILLIMAGLFYLYSRRS